MAHHFPRPDLHPRDRRQRQESDRAMRLSRLGLGRVEVRAHLAGDAVGIACQRDDDLAADVEALVIVDPDRVVVDRSEEHTSELQSLMRISYAVFCLKKQKPKTTKQIPHI